MSLHPPHHFRPRSVGVLALALVSACGSESATPAAGPTVAQTDGAEGEALDRLAEGEVDANPSPSSEVMGELPLAGAVPAATGGSNASEDRGPWRNVVIGGGGFVTGIVEHPAEAGLSYARTDIGGSYRRDRATASWQPLQDGMGRDDADRLGVLSVAVDPNFPDAVYQLTGKYTQSWAGNGVLLISRDRGETYDRVDLPFKVGGNEDGRGAGERLVVDPNDGRRLWLGSTRDGLWRSASAGTSFERVEGFEPTHVTAVVLDGLSGTPGVPTQRGFVLASEPAGGVWQTVDGGLTFELLAEQPTGLLPLRAVMAGRELFVTYANAVGPNDATEGAVYRYSVETGQWTDVSPPQGQYGFSGVTAARDNPMHLVVSTLDRWFPNDELYQSLDGGVSWQPLLATATFDHSSAPYAEGSNPHWLTDVQLDPFDANRARFVTGYGLWSCEGLLTAADALPCAFDNQGLEETVPLQIVSPPSGAPLISAFGDIDGFVHEQLDQSPAQGRFQPQVGTTRGLAYAEREPARLVKAFDEAPFGALSEDGGDTWTAFASAPPGASAAGTRSIALSADGDHIVWSPSGALPSHSGDAGATWTAVAGELPAGLSPVADRMSNAHFYALDALNGQLWVSEDGGVSFGVGAGGLPALPDYLLGEGQVVSVAGEAGELWVTTGSGGLFRSTDFGQTLAPVSSVAEAYALGVGLGASGQGSVSFFLGGTPGGQPQGLYRSDDAGTRWVRIDDDQHRFGWIHTLIGDPRRHGRVYVATEGRGIVYRDL